MPDPETICGYTLSDVRRELRDAVDKRERRAAQRWTAELVATPGAVGSLWASYWLAWAAAQGAGAPSPVIPILLKQFWATAATAAHGHADAAGDAAEGWRQFRNDPKVRSITTEVTARLLTQPRQTPVVWPSREITIFDVGTMREQPPPPAADSDAVLQVWQRSEDHMELRLMAGRWIASLEAGELRAALSAVAWTLLPHQQQGSAQPLRCADRGPAALPAKQRQSPIWFWLDIGKAFLSSRGPSIHRGWVTLHAAVAEAFRLHWKRWTATERMRILLAWILQMRSALELNHPADLWTSPPLQFTAHEVDLPYKEIAAELAHPDAAIQRAPPKPAQLAADDKKAVAARMEAKMAEADAAVLAALGLDDE
jgi:hypothetical protein